MSVNILQAIRDPRLLGPWFTKRGDDDTWSAWFAFLSAAFALPMTDAQRALYTQCTGRTEAPTETARELWLICGRRSGKSFILAVIAVFLACFFDYAKYLTRGERGVVLVLASDRRQSRVVFRYVRGLLANVPMLARLIERETDDTIDLKNNISVEIATASFRSVRGYTIVAALNDEIAFWPGDDAASPDTEVLNSIKPAMATIPTAMLLACSSPHSKKGALFSAFKDHYGKDGDPVLVWKAPTRTMNPTVSQAVIDAAMERDTAHASAEYLAEFRADLADFVDRETVLACVEKNVRERPRRYGVKYHSFTDPSGDSHDSMTAAIGHLEGNVIVLDALREIVSPFDPESATDELVRLNRSYGIGLTHGDRYAAQWTATAFEKRGVAYRHSELPKSSLYLNLLPRLNSKTIKLLDHPRSINQIASLERKTFRGGKDSIDHPAQARDDIANSIAGLAFVATNQRESPVAETRSFGLLRGDFSPQPARWSPPCLIDFSAGPPSGPGFSNISTWRK